MVRFKNRWLLVEFIAVAGPSSSEPLDAKAVHSALKQSILSHFGDAGWGAVGFSLTVKYVSPMTHVAIIRVARDRLSIAWGGVTLLNDIGALKIIPHVVHLSGTIKHAQLAAIAHNRKLIARLRATKSVGVSVDQRLEQSELEIKALKD